MVFGISPGEPFSRRYIRDQTLLSILYVLPRERIGERAERKTEIKELGRTPHYEMVSVGKRRFGAVGPRRKIEVLSYTTLHKQ